MTKLPPANELTYFYEVALAENFSLAAKKLNVSQPSLSMAIKRLEDQLKTTLFSRQKHGVSLTRAGQELFNYVKNLLQQWDNIRYLVTSAHDEVKGKVTIGCNSSISPYMGIIIANLLAQYPALEINLIHQLSACITQAVVDSTMDIGIVINPAEHAGLIIRKYHTTEMTFWTPDETRAKQPLSCSQSVLLCDPDIPQTSQLLAKLNKLNMKFSKISHITGVDAIANLAIAGCGTAILPSCYVEAFYQGKLHRISNAPYCRDNVCLIYKNESKEVLAIQTVLTAIKQFIHKHLGVQL